MREDKQKFIKINKIYVIKNSKGISFNSYIKFPNFVKTIHRDKYKT